MYTLILLTALALSAWADARALPDTYDALSAPRHVDDAAGWPHTGLIVLPRVLNTGVSNVTAAFGIINKTSSDFAWSVAVHYDGRPPWAVIDPANGTVTADESLAVPVTVYRNLLPQEGVYTARVDVVLLPLDGTSTWAVVTNAVRIVTRVASNACGILAAIGGSGRAYAGVPYTLDARGSQGWIDDYFWVTNYDPGVALGAQAIASGIVETVVFTEPEVFDLTLFGVDPHGRVGRADVTNFTVWNSQPSVDPGGPYYAAPSSLVTVVATGYDPSPGEQLRYAWQFDPPYGPFTSQSASPTGTFICVRARNFYVVCVVSDTWTGAVMTYNGARGNRAFAQIIVTNERPRAELRYRIDDGAWSAWSNRHTLVLPVLAVTGLQAEARALTGGGLVTPVPVEWREYAGNPTHGLVTLSNRYSNSVALTPFTQPGVHLYTVLANSGLARSEPGILTVSAPGVRGRVVAEGFQTRVPVWGAYAAPGTPGNTNALGWPDDPVATLSDEHGTLTLDRRPWAPAYVELERDAAQGEQRGYQFRSQMTAPVRGEQIFRFPVRTYRFGGQLLANLSNNVTGVPDAFATLVMHPGVRVHGLCNDVGSFSFGKLPQPWPADSETTGTYYFVFLKDGHNSVCIARTPAQIAAQRINERFVMPVSGATIQLCGTVRAATSLQPVPGALVHFGPFTVVADTNGEFCFSTLPKPYRAEPGSPSHVLVAEADEYFPTRNIYSNTFDGGNVDVFVNGGGHRVYGTIYDSFSGNIATGAAVRVPHPPAPGSTVVYGEDGAVFSSDSGFYTIDVPGGCEYVTIETRDRYEVVPIPPDHSGEDPIQLDIELLPEPALGFALVMFAAWRLRRAG